MTVVTIRFVAGLDVVVAGFVIFFLSLQIFFVAFAELFLLFPVVARCVVAIVVSTAVEKFMWWGRGITVRIAVEMYSGTLGREPESHVLAGES